MAAALLLAVVLAASSGEWAPTAFAGTAVLGVVVGLVALTWVHGWPVLPVVTVAVVVVGCTASALFYDQQSDVPPDLRVSGIDAIGMDPAGVTILLPFVWALIVLVLACRILRRASRWTFGSARRERSGRPALVGTKRCLGKRRR